MSTDGIFAIGPKGRGFNVDASGRLVVSTESDQGLYPYSFGPKGRPLVVDGSGRLVLSPQSIGLGDSPSGIDGAGSAGRVPIFADSNSLTDSPITASGTSLITRVESNNGVVIGSVAAVGTEDPPLDGLKIEGALEIEENSNNSAVRLIKSARIGFSDDYNSECIIYKYVTNSAIVQNKTIYTMPENSCATFHTTVSAYAFPGSGYSKVFVGAYRNIGGTVNSMGAGATVYEGNSQMSPTVIHFVLGQSIVVRITPASADPTRWFIKSDVTVSLSSA